MTQKQLLCSLTSNILGVYDFVEDDKFVSQAVIYIDFDDETQKLIAGTCCNAGINEITSIEYGDDFSIDSNLEALNEALSACGFEAI